MGGRHGGGGEHKPFTMCSSKGGVVMNGGLWVAMGSKGVQVLTYGSKMNVYVGF